MREPRKLVVFTGQVVAITLVFALSAGLVAKEIRDMRDHVDAKIKEVDGRRNAQYGVLRRDFQNTIEAFKLSREIRGER